MKMAAGLCLLLAGALVFLFGASEVFAQAKRVTPHPVGAPVIASGKENVVIRKMEATGPGAKVKTPAFASDVNESQSQSFEWARISVQYETDADWIDELEFRYMVLVKHPKTGMYIMFPATVSYIDIPKGKRHVSTVFLRPNTVERYGAVEWAGVKIYLKGKDTPVAVTQMPENDLRPWTATTVATREGVLLNRDQTPFAMVAIDNYETIKPK